MNVPSVRRTSADRYGYPCIVYAHGLHMDDTDDCTWITDYGDSPMRGDSTICTNYPYVQKYDSVLCIEVRL